MLKSIFTWLVVSMTVLVSGIPVRAADPQLTCYRDVTLVEHPYNDGDSFFVQVGDRQFHLRLYFTDCPEDAIFQDHDARRVQEQSRYFGIENAERIIWYGHQAAAFTKEVLSRPFTVYTAHARAPGGPNSHRIYAFVVTAEGRDLGELLVENGFARNYGVTRARYDGVASREVEMRLRDLEISATLANRGIWSESNADIIADSRRQQRAESAEFKALFAAASGPGSEPIDINTASQRELERLPGVGPVTATRIIEHRPYASVDDLKSVPGIGSKTLENIRPYIGLNAPADSNG